tara:strand:+ start:3008 stop:6322 length:3315 start_codon:yes stop_codon:yes gene_type:complete
MPPKNSKIKQMKSSKTNIKTSDKCNSTNDELVSFITYKVRHFQNIINKTTLIVQRYKLLEIFGASELNVCIQGLDKIHDDLTFLEESINENDIESNNKLVNRLQSLNTDLSGILRNFGTDSIEDLITVCFGQDFINNFITIENKDKYELIKNNVHPIGYKIVAWRENVNPQNKVESKIVKNRIIEDMTIAEESCDLDCFDLARSSKSFQTKVYGIKVSIHNHELRKTMIICGIVDDVLLKFMSNKYISNKLNQIKNIVPDDEEFTKKSFQRFVECLTLKDMLIYTYSEIHNKFMGHINQVYLMKQKAINQIVREFTSNELYMQRLTLIQLLLKGDESEFQYLAYLLYDLLSNESNNSIDTIEQTILYDSLPWSIKRCFRDAMKQTIQYTNNLCNFDNSKIPLEQQICLMKANDVIKEKAMVKLKEVKAKSEDSGSKARQYLEGLLRIPFNTYKEEDILVLLSQSLNKFNNLMKTITTLQFSYSIPIKDTYNIQEMLTYSSILEKNYVSELDNKRFEFLKKIVENDKRTNLIDIISNINQVIKTNKLQIQKLCHSGKKQDYMINAVLNFLNTFKENKKIMSDIENVFVRDDVTELNEQINSISDDITYIDNNKKKTITYIKTIRDTLENAVHGHEKAKRQVERIIGQWITGEQSGYCFGFEGPPGVGKTSLAKLGLANCLKDEDGVSRPFAFIAIGGASNSSTLDGHNYTYVGSTWGKIVDILMEKKCMNPIIFIDELDKVSKTEHGKEIIGILTHLIDSTQNSAFQDKYFTGIDLDLSKALFIFSYNDVEAIDSILLDRIHRVKFDHLTLEDKLVICKKYILPELFKKNGLEDNIKINDDVLSFIISMYTCEPGVRKLKEVLFEIIAEINLERLQDINDVKFKTLELTIELVKDKYLKNRQQIREKKIHPYSKVGMINGLWANALGRGGIIPIETSFYPSNNNFDFKLTGMQGDVMKESMNVAKTLAWSLTPKSRQEYLLEDFSNVHKGLHIHCPEGAVPKDGPSAGGAITVTLYSLFNNIKIKNDVGMTGEITLQGNITAIGGLDLKIVGGIRAGVKTFLYPQENKREFSEFMEKYENNDLIKGITFCPVSNIHEALKIVLVE